MVACGVAIIPFAPTARPSPNGRFSRRERAAPRSISAGEAAGFSRRITESYASRDSAHAKTTNPQRVSVIAKITFLPNRVKQGLIVFLNAKLRYDFSGGPPVKTGGFPPTYGVGGGAGYARSKKFSARFASPLSNPVGNRRAFLIKEKRSRLTTGDYGGTLIMARLREGARSTHSRQRRDHRPTGDFLGANAPPRAP